jgi:N12 class adenine-specific DNA methylase
LALAPAQVEAVRLYIGVRDALKGQIAIDKTEPEPSARSDAHRQVLKDAYDAAVLNGGSFTQLLKRIATIIPHEPWIGTVNGLEDVREEPAEKAGAKPVRTYHPAKILTNRTIFASALPSRAENLPDAVNQSRASLGRIDCAYVAGQLGKDGASPDVIEGISAAICDAGLGFRDPGDLNTIIPADIYRSGALAKKLARAKRAAEVDARFQSNVSALENAMPAPATWSSIRAPLGAQFVPPLLYARFLADEFDLVVRDKDMPKFVLYEPARGCWHIREEYITASHRASRYSSEEITVEKVVDHAFAQTEPLVKVDGALDMAETDVARNLVSQLGAAWTRYVEANADVREEIVMAYNERFTSFVPLKPDTTYMQFPGLSPHFKPRSHQISAIAKLLPEPNGVVAYNVGFGKTAIGIILAAESRRIGAAKKPLIVCDGANYMQFVQAMRELYPAFRLLVADDANFSPSERERFKASMAFGDYDCILVSRTQFERIPVSASMKSDWIQRELAELRAQSASMGGSANKRAAKDQAKAIEALDAELTRLMHERTEDRGMTWDQLGVDLLVVDESHRHKKIGIKTVHDRIKGIDTGRSNRGYDLLIKARYIQERRNGNGVIGLTGTPCTNTMAEFHTSILIFAPNVCKELGIEHFDAFKSMFCQVRDELVMNESSGKWKMEQHLSKFVNGPAFIRFVRLGMLVEMDSSKLKLNIPEHVNGNIEHEVVPLNEQTLSVMERLGALYSTYENLAGDEKKEMCWVPLVLMQMGMVASIDPRMLNPTLPVAPDGLLSRVVQNTAGIYADPELAGKAQVIFLDRYGEMDTSKLDALEKGGMKPSGKLVLDESNDSEDSDDEEAPEKLESKKPRLNLYYEIRDMLIARGIKPGDIACVCDVAKKDRAALFAKVNSGAIRIVIGSSDKLGIGANFQKNLYAAHHVDPARNMTPDQMEQRNGRILRDGNTNKKVRVIYYGMEDTCCPAIFGRIQRKSDFIRQGYAEQGVGAEFEDVSSVRLEELKAALIPDKRAMQLAELKSELADALRLVDSGKLRHRQIANDLSNATSALDYLKGVGGQRASKREAWFAANTTPIADPQTTSELELDVVVDLTSLYFGTPELKKWYEENGPELRGPAKAVVKALDTLSALQTDVSIPSSELKRDLGTIKINGLPIRLSREQVSFISGRESTELVAKVSDPVVAGADIIQPNRYRTGTMMLKVGRLAAFEAKNDAVTIASRISDMERRKAGFLEDLAANPMPSELGVSEIRAKVKAVEKNMAETPYVRGSKLRQARSAVIAGMNAVSGVVEEVIQATIPPVQLRA